MLVLLLSFSLLLQIHLIHAHQFCKQCPSQGECVTDKYFTLDRDSKDAKVQHFYLGNQPYHATYVKGSNPNVMQGVLSNDRGAGKVVYEVIVNETPYYLYLYGPESCTYRLKGTYIISIAVWV